jgi:hypothetical protein
MNESSSESENNDGEVETTLAIEMKRVTKLLNALK